jgi:hypothetical protein
MGNQFNIISLSAKVSARSIRMRPETFFMSKNLSVDKLVRAADSAVISVSLADASVSQILSLHRQTTSIQFTQYRFHSVRPITTFFTSYCVNNTDRRSSQDISRHSRALRYREAHRVFILYWVLSEVYTRLTPAIRAFYGGRMAAIQSSAVWLPYFFVKN